MAIKVALVIGLLMLFRCAAWAGSFDVCYNPQDIQLQGRLVTIAAPIFAGGTIPFSFSPINCDEITAPKLGTAFATGSVVSGLRYAGVIDTMMVTLELRIYGGDKLLLAGVTKRGIGQSYDLVVSGANGLVPAAGVVVVVNLDPLGTAFEIDY